RTQTPDRIIGNIPILSRYHYSMSLSLLFYLPIVMFFVFFFQAEDGIRDDLPHSPRLHRGAARRVEEAGLPHARLHRLHRHRRADHAGRWLLELEVSLFGDARLPDRFWVKVLNHPASGCREGPAALEQQGNGR